MLFLLIEQLAKVLASSNFCVLAKESTAVPSNSLSSLCALCFDIL